MGAFAACLRSVQPEGIKAPAAGNPCSNVTKRTATLRTNCSLKLGRTPPILFLCVCVCFFVCVCVCVCVKKTGHDWMTNHSSTRSSNDSTVDHFGGSVGDMYIIEDAISGMRNTKEVGAKGNVARLGSSTWTALEAKDVRFAPCLRVLPMPSLPLEANT